jgi:hypothetical protein
MQGEDTTGFTELLQVIVYTIVHIKAQKNAKAQSLFFAPLLTLREQSQKINPHSRRYSTFAL